MVGTYIERDLASELVNTGGDTDTKFVKLMNKTSANSVPISFSIAKNATERLKWITEGTELNGLDWEDGIYTWEFEVKTPNSNLSIVEVILRRLSSDGTKVKASRSSGSIPVNLGTTGLKIGPIAWNDGTQNPAGRAADDRLEIVFRVKNSNVISAENCEIGANTTNNELFFATPISVMSGTSPVYDIIGATRRIKQVHGAFVIIGRKWTRIHDIPHFVDKYLTKIHTIQVSNCKSVTKLHDIISQLSNKSVTKLHNIIGQLGNFAQSFYERRRLLGMVKAHLWDLLNVGKKSNVYLSNIMQFSSKTSIRLCDKIQSATKIQTNRLLHGSLPYVFAEAKHLIVQTRDEWSTLFRMEFNEIAEASKIAVLVKSKLSESTFTGKKQRSAYYTLPMLRPIDSDDVKERVKQLEFENHNLRQELRALRYKVPRGIAMILSCTGGASLVISYFYTSMILTFIGLGLTLWGVVLFYVLPSRHVPGEVVDAMSLHLIKTLDSLLVSLGYDGRAVFHHPKHLGDLTQGYVFVPYDSVYGVPKDHDLAKGKLFCDDPKGISIVAPSQGLVDLFERKLSVKFADVDLAYLQENLPKLLVEDLRLIDDISLEHIDGIMQVKIVGRSCAYICDSINKQTKLGNKLGCPLCGSIALVISKVSGKPVTIKESNVKNDSIETSYLMLDA